MKKLLLLLFAAAFLSGTFAATPYGGLFENQSGLTTAKSSFITLRMAGDKLWMEIPVKYMGREMLIGSTLTAISDGRFGNVGYKQQDPLHIRFALRDSTLLIQRVNAEIATDYASQALKKVNIDPVLWSYPVVARGYGNSSVVVEMSDLFLDSPKQFDFFSTEVAWSPTLKRENSTLDCIKAFDDNLSVKSTLQFTVSAEGILDDDEPVTAQVTRSILLLPEDKMMPRISDSRVGVFSTDKTRFSVTNEGSQYYSVAKRWRIVPSDVEAYMRGELVEPTKKILFYVEPTFPELWKAPIKRAVESWNVAFEAIGFKNVMEARPFPTPEEDPDFDPDNLKYSCIRFLPSITINAMGPSWADPTTGEVICASVIVWSDVAKLINKWRFVQTSQVDPRVRTRKMPDDIFTESLQYVLAHEVGHTLGFAHSMASSSAWPVDSLRSTHFTQKYGTTPSIMDYARFNYIAQPEDVGKGLRLIPPEIGVQDYFLVKWTYKYTGYTDEWDEALAVEGWVDETVGNPVHRYGRQQFSTLYDPSALNEDLGDDPIRASDYGIANLKYILPRMREWIMGDPDYQHRKMLYDELCEQYYRYLRNVLVNVGGLYLTEVKEGTLGKHIVPVPRDVQKKSLHWVMNQYRHLEWLDEPSLRRNFALGVPGAADMRQRVADSFRTRIQNVVLSSYYAHSIDGEHAYTIQEFMDDLYRETWKNTRAGRKPTNGDHILQKAMVDMFCTPLAAMGGGSASAITINAHLSPSQDASTAYGDGRRSVDESVRFGPAGMNLQDPVDVSALDDSADHLVRLALRSRALLHRAVVRSSGTTKAHYQALLMKLNAALKDKL